MTSSAAQQEKSVCQSWSCATIFDGVDRYCPACGNPAVPQKRIRRLGALQIACGVILVVLMGAVSWFTVPIILAHAGVPGEEMSRQEGLLIIGLFAMLIAFGVGAIAAGWSALRNGRQNWKLAGVMFGVIVVICFAAYGVELGLIG